MYRIGEFSYLFQVTVKTLLHYEKKGIFIPSYVDPFTGYRYYSDEQREEFLNILKLKELGFGLEEVKNLKDHLSDEKIQEKIVELQKQKDKLDLQIKNLEKLYEGVDSSYTIGLTFACKMFCVGYRRTLAKRDNEKEQELFMEVARKLDKLKISHHTKVIITEEVGFKTKDIDLFIGYRIAVIRKNYDKIKRKFDKMGLEVFAYPTDDYLVALDIQNYDKADVCSRMVKYAADHQIQILGPFMELYDEDEVDIYAFANCLNLPKDVVEERSLKRYISSLEESIRDNKDILGTWQIREILPNISFDATKHKNNLDTIYQEFSFFPNGLTNYENVHYNGNHLIISYGDRKIYNFMTTFQKDGKEYLEIRMNSLSEIYDNARPISYIYEKK